MAAKAKVVLTDYVWESLDVEKKTLAGLAELVPLQTKKPEEFIAQAADCDALLNTYAGPITAEVMAKMPRCRIIARYGIGVDTIDLDAATAAGIIVTNNPTYCIEEVAEHSMALLLAAARKVAYYDRLVRAGRWEVPPGKPLYRVAGRTLGLVGFGNIARQVAVRAGSFKPPQQPGSPAARDLAFAAPKARTRNVAYIEPPSTGDIDMTTREFILSVGRGVGEQDNIERFRELADALGASLGCSRPVADSGWLPKSRQIGQSGKTAASCKLYVAMGISGAIQHLAGMKHVETVVAVNTDPNASIFTVARYGVVGDMFEIADELEKQLG